VKLSEWQLLTTWVHDGMVISYPLSCFLFIAAMASPLLWISSAPARQRPSASVIGLWCIFYAGLLVWLFNSPVFRFGISYMLLCILVPLTAWLGRFPRHPTNGYG